MPRVRKLSVHERFSGTERPKTLKKQLKPSRTTNIFYTSKLRLSVFRGTCRRMTHKNNGLPKPRPYHANVKFWSHSSILTQGRIGTFVLILCIGPWGMTLVSIIYAVIWSGRFLLYGGRYVQEWFWTVVFCPHCGGFCNRGSLLSEVPLFSIWPHSNSSVSHRKVFKPDHKPCPYHAHPQCIAFILS